MSSNRKEERNEKIIRGLLKLPPNRRCINCDSLGPQYVCTDFWTFVCMTCSGIHREFTHRVKSVSMAKFTAQEVEALQKGGNQRARETFLKVWDLESKKLPDSSKVDRIREFIQQVYVDKKFVEAEYLDKLPSKIEILKSCGDYRRSSSYHSYSQSPPNDHQYGRKLHGKQFANHARKPGSEGGHYGGKIFSFVRRQIAFSDRPHGERHASENSNLSSRTSDHSMATAVDKFRLDGHPPNSKQDLHGLPHSERTSSSSSTGSFASNSKTLGAVNSAVAEALISPLSQSSSCANATNQDLFSQHAVEASMVSSAQSVDMFTDVTHQQSPSDSLAPEILAYPFSENDQWATFDTFCHTEPTTGTNNQLPRLDLPVDQYLHADAFASMHGYSSECFSTDGSANHLACPISDHICLDEVKMPANPKTSQQWNAFDDDAMENNSCTLFSTPLQNNGSQVGTNSNKKSTNPFDLPYDSDQELNTEFMDIFSLQEALPNLHSSAFSGSTPEPWHPQEPITHYSSSVSPGIAYIAEQVPGSQLLNIQSQVSGNPFA